MNTTLITASALAARLDDPGVVIVDCRHDLTHLAAGRDSYAAGHIRNAVFADMESALSGAKRGADGQFRGRHPLPERADLIDTLRDWGVNDATQVVAYDAHGGMFAARLWWLLRWLGPPSAAVLVGGRNGPHQRRALGDGAASPRRRLRRQRQCLRLPRGQGAVG
ncbi:MAG: hypothetical protein H7335_19565, partial [Massilia sp.]|nr:hypothetical protein [Massilia sp.]